MFLRIAGFLILASLLTGFSAARDEEEEDKKPKGPLKKVPVPGETPAVPKPAPGMPGKLPGIDPANPTDSTPPAPKNPAPPTPGTPQPEKEEKTEPESSAGAYVVKMTDLQREANLAKQPELKAFYNQFSTAFDRITIGLKAAQRVTPLPLLWGKDKFPDEFGIVPLAADDAVEEAKSVTKRTVREVECFELYTVEQVKRFTTAPLSAPTDDSVSQTERLNAAEKVLVAVFFFHESAREQNRRKGKNWDPVRTSLLDKLAEVRLARLKLAGILREWATIKELTRKYESLYKNQPRILEQVLAARLLEAESLVKSESLPDWVRSREILTEYEGRFPSSTNEVAVRVRKLLKEKSTKLMNEAERIFGNNKTEARNILQSVEKIDPDNANLRTMQQDMKFGYPVFIIGARRMPELMSPALARNDAEKQIADLVFEGLLETIPDELTGVRFTPKLTTDRGAVSAGLRDYRLVGNAEWGVPDASLFSAADVSGTLRLMRQKSGLVASEAAMWFDDPGFDPADPGRLRMRFKLGHPDPRSLLTMKVLPAGKLLEMNKALDDLDFARQPFGSGPYKLNPIRRNANEPIKEVILLANPAYAKRPGKSAQPFIKEVRFVDVNLSTDHPADFRADRLHMLTDVPSKDLGKFSAENNLGGKVKTITVADPHRTYMLAINHRRPGLQNLDVRKGLLHSIHRELILTDIYRPANMKELHKSLTGPFPAGSWAVPKPLGGTPAALYNRDLAANKFRSYLGSANATPSLSLIYPDDDAQVKAACERMKAMIESPTSADERKMIVQLEPLPYREMIRRIEDEARYDLAFLPVDHDTQWYPQTLSYTLDPTAIGKGGRNIFGYLGEGTTPTPEDLKLGQTLAECRLYRDFDGKLVNTAHRIHQQFLDAVPYIPLWQLDRHIVISTNVKLAFEGQVDDGNPRLLNPTTPLPSIARWRVE
jgi:peptide/nickel transport system substrate-binding protein